jgi:single-strand DNA-binding protein
MPSFNKVILAGNLTRDPEPTTTPKGTVIAAFGLAINRHWTTEAGEKREEVTFLDCKAFGRQAEVISQHCRKGSALLLEGRIAREQWEDKDTGEKKSATRIIVESFQFLGSRPGNPPAAQEPTPDAPPF